MSATRGTRRIGTSGYHYAHWREIFYSRHLPQQCWFAYYASFDTVEINNTFYHLPQAQRFDGWRAQAPPDFCYALKCSRYGSHLKRLKEPHAVMARFLDRAQRLRACLGPILVQLPPHWRPDPARLTDFLQAAPRRSRWAIECRDPRWLCDKVSAIRRSTAAALCLHDRIADHPRCLPTAWTSRRLHGGREGGSYPRQALLAHARQSDHYLADGLDVFVYCNNDAHGAVVHNAADLRQYIQGNAVVVPPGAGDNSTRGRRVRGEGAQAEAHRRPQAHRSSEGGVA
jgi:uncharacterized protein YecE (DUF72 family)